MLVIHHFSGNTTVQEQLLKAAQYLGYQQTRKTVHSHSQYNITKIPGDINATLTLTGLQNSYITISILELDHQLYECNGGIYLMISDKGKLCDQQDQFDVHPRNGSVTFQ